MAKRLKKWRVDVYKPGLQAIIFQRLEIHAIDANVAKNKAKKIVYKLGRLAHFYTYVPVEVVP